MHRLILNRNRELFPDMRLNIGQYHIVMNGILGRIFGERKVIVSLCAGRRRVHGDIEAFMLHDCSCCGGAFRMRSGNVVVAMVGGTTRDVTESESIPDLSAVWVLRGT